MARGLVPFCRMPAPAPLERPGYGSYSEAVAAHPGESIVHYGGGGTTGAPSRFGAKVRRHKAVSRHKVARVSSKPTGEMKPAQINAELDKLDALVSTLNNRMIADGRGYETSEQTWQASDPLALEWQAASQRRIDLLREIERRYQGGPSFRAPSRFPSGWRAGR